MTMSMRDDFLTEKMMAFLDRLSPPRKMADNEKAKLAEMKAIMRELSRVAPREPTELWWADFEAELDRTMEYRVWPTVREISKVGGRVSRAEAVGRENVIEWEPDPLRISANRIREGRPVGDAFLYGKHAVAMMRAGLVTEDDLQKYRSALFFTMLGIHGREKAERLERAMVARHEDALRVAEQREKGELSEDAARMAQGEADDRVGYHVDPDLDPAAGF
jgi:hypothetical protein